MRFGNHPVDQPSSLRTTSAICPQYFSVTAADGPSTITRHMFWVPE
jgi:hypothetical protein